MPVAITAIAATAASAASPRGKRLGAPLLPRAGEVGGAGRMVVRSREGRVLRRRRRLLVTGERAGIPPDRLGGIRSSPAVVVRGRSQVVFRHDPAQHPLGFGHIKTAGRILAEEPLDHRPNGPAATAELVVDHGGQAGQRAIPLERRVALDRRIKRSSQRPQIRRRSCRSAACAFGCEVGGRTEQDPRCGQGRAVGGLGDPKVGQHNPALRPEQDIRGFYVTVHDTGVCTARRAASTLRPIRAASAGTEAGRRERHRAASGSDELHDDGRLVVLLDDVVYADHVRVPQPRGQPRLSHRALAGDLPFVRGHLRRPDDFLYRHVPVEQFVARPPDRTLPRGR